MTNKKFNHGDSVTCEICRAKITDAKISIDGDGIPFICQNEIEGLRSFGMNMFGYKYSWMLSKDFTELNVTNLKLAIPKKDIADISTYAVGDIIVDKDGSEAKVLAVCGELFAKSFWDEFDVGCGWFTAKQAVRMGWKFKDAPEPPAEMTQEEIEKKLGYKITIVKK